MIVNGILAKINKFGTGHLWQIAIFVAISFLLIFLRWYKLESGLLFYNDMGRDFVVLLNWQESGKPPLLGPQTSVLSYNQSAWYFYFLYPLFLLTKQWAFSSTLTLTVVAISIYGFLAYQTRRDHSIFFAISITMFLLAIHPQAIYQSRFIWNPSFVPYFLLLGLTAMLKLKNKFDDLWLAVFWIGVVFAVGFSYSAVPIAVVMFLFLLVAQRQHWLKILSFGIISTFVVMLPMIGFEIRHNFALTKLFLEGQTGQQNEISFVIKNRKLIEYIFPKLTILQIQFLLATFITSIGFSFYYFKKNKFKSELKSLLFFIPMFVLIILAQYLLPINIEKHYIFPLLTLGFFALGLSHKKIAIATALIAFALFVAPPNGINSDFYQPATRTVADMETCYQKFCSNYSESAYVSMESGVMPGYHNAPEHQFFLRKAGCQILDIEKSQDASDQMLVIEDSGKFDPGKAGYRELTLFGNYTLGKAEQCTQNLSIVEIKKVNTDAVTNNEVFQPQ